MTAIGSASRFAITVPITTCSDPSTSASPPAIVGTTLACVTLDSSGSRVISSAVPAWVAIFARSAAITSDSATFAARSWSADVWTTTSFVSPPRVATSATPGTASSAGRSIRS